MSGMKTKVRDNSKSLIDCVRPSEADGPLLGAVFATYGLSLDQPDFFGQDFLPTLLGLGSVRDRGYASPVTLDRVLATSDVSLICDAHAVAAGARPTLRVDVLPVGHKVHHAKLVLIHREHRVRLILGSANLTHEGYRRQREMAVVLDFHEGGKLPASVLTRAVARWQEVLGDSADAQVRRLFSGAAQQAQSWQLPNRLLDGFAVEVVFGGGTTPLWKQFVDAWPVGEPVLHWGICSPFWPESDGKLRTNPFITLTDALTAKGASITQCELEVITRADGPSNRALPRFPFALVAQLREHGFPIRGGSILPARLEVADDEALEGMAAENRELHAKWLFLAGPRTSLALVGSANFTRKGLGTLDDPLLANIEACVLLKWPSDRCQPEQWRPPIFGQTIDWASCAGGDLGEPLAEEKATADWPEFIQQVELGIHWQNLPEPDGELVMRLRSTDWPEYQIEFVTAEEDMKGLLGIRCLPAATTELRLPVTPPQVRSLLVRRTLRIIWADGRRRAFFPVNVLHESKAAMPTVVGMKPTEEQLLAYFHGRVSEEDLLARLEQQAREGAVQPHDGQPDDNESLRKLQNYVVREFVESLYGLNQTLRESCFSLRAAEQALLGEFSPVSLAEQVMQALNSGRRSPTAAAFQLVELIRVVTELKVIAAGFEDARNRAIDRLFVFAKQAAERPDFADVICDRDFAAFVQASLPASSAQRWASLAPDGLGRGKA